jgi:uncharacterized protein YwlG (UPF0340 family)
VKVTKQKSVRIDESIYQKMLIVRKKTGIPLSKQISLGMPDWIEKALSIAESLDK